MNLSTNTTPSSPVLCNESRINHFNIYFIYFVLILYTFVFIFGTVGNLLTCLAVFIHKSMRRSIHVYMVNLAMADMIILLLFVPTESLLLINNLAWNMGPTVCLLTSILNPMCVTCSIATLSAISLDRYSGVRDPFAWRIKSTRNAKVVVPLTWVISICAALPYFMFGGLKQTKSGSCVCMWPNSVVKTWYMFVTMVLQYVFPFVLIASISAHIIWIIARGRESINKLHRRMVKMVTLMLVTYLICDGMPYVHFYYELYHGSSTGASSNNQLHYDPATGSSSRYKLYDNPHDDAYAAYVYVFSNFLLTLQAALNPLIYSSIRDDFNLAFKTLISACGFTLTSIIVPGRDSLTEHADSRKISRTDTERMYLNSLDRERRLSSFRIRSTENMTAHLVVPEPRKVSIYQAARKHSVRELRKQSSVRERPLISPAPQSDNMGEMNSSDIENDKPVTFRTYRLGTLEYIDLETFHKRMKTEIRKESRVQKLSKMFLQYQRNRRSNESVQNSYHSSTPDLSRPNMAKKRQSCDGTVISKSQSYDSLPSGGTLTRRVSRRPQYNNATKLLSNSLLPLTFLVGEVSQNSSRKNSFAVGEAFQNLSNKNLVAAGETQNGGKKNSNCSSNPNSRGRSRASTLDPDVAIGTEYPFDAKGCSEEADLTPSTKETSKVPIPPPPPVHDNDTTSKEKIKHNRDRTSTRKWSLDSVIGKLKEAYPNDCVLSVMDPPVNQTISPKNQSISPKRRRRKKAIQSARPIMETGRKLSQNITECIRLSTDDGAIKKLGRKYSHDVIIQNYFSNSVPKSTENRTFPNDLQKTEKKEILTPPKVERKPSIIGAALKRIVNVVTVEGRDKNEANRSEFKISIKRSPIPSPVQGKCTVNILSPLDENICEANTRRNSCEDSSDDERTEEVPGPTSRPYRKISIHEKKSYKDMLGRPGQFNLQFTPVLPTSQETSTSETSEQPRDYKISIRNNDMVKFHHTKESTC